MGGLTVGPFDQSPDVLDIGELIRQKRIRDLLGLQRQSSLSGDPIVDLSSLNKAPIAPSQTTAPVGPPSQQQSLYQVPQSTEALKQTIQNAPDISQYHPGRFRNILAGIGGFGRTIETGDPAQGLAAKQAIAYAPFQEQMNRYQQKVGQAKAVSDIDTAIEDRKMKAAQEEATIEHLKEQAKAEAARGNAEMARQMTEVAQRLKLLKETELLPTTHEQAHKEKLEEITAQHPDNTVTPFDIWRKQHPDQDVSEWLKLEAQNKPESITEFNTFRTGYLGKHPNATGDEIAKAYSDATTKPPQNLMVQPIEGGGGLVINARPGTVVAPGSMTPSQMGQEQVSKDKEIEQERTAKKKAAEDYATAQRLVSQAENAKDPSTAASADAALVMRLAGAIKPDALGKLRWQQAEQDFLIKKTRSSGGDFEALFDKVAGGQHIILTSQQRKAFLETIRNVSLGPESMNQAPSDALPGGITLDDINAEIERRKKK